MELSDYSEIAKIMANQIKSFDFDRENDAKAYVASQVSGYGDLIRKTFNGVDESIINGLATLVSGCIKLMRRGNKYVVYSDIPLVDGFDKIENLTSRDKDFGRSVIFYYLFNMPSFSAVASDIIRARGQELNLITIGHITRIASAHWWFVYIRQIDSDMRIMYDRLESVVIDGEKKVSIIESSIEKMVAEIQSKEGEAGLKIDGIVKDTKEKLEGLRAAGLEMAKLSSAMEIWGSKRRRHGRLAWGGSALFVVFLISVFWLMFGEWAFVREEILIPLRSPGAAGGYAYLAAFAVPVIAVGWVLRIFTKVINSSFVLSDDAAQREALLKTYYQLVADKEADMKPSDRLLVLNALFRPLPGHHNEDINPPTFADVVGDIFKAKS